MTTVSEVPHDQRIVHSSEDPNWRTAPELISRLNVEGVVDFDVDLAADFGSRICAEYFGPDHVNSTLRDALTIPWHTSGFYRGWLNPPYSRARYRETHDPAMLVGNWAAKCWEESRAGFEVWGLFPYTPQTSWWRGFVEGIAGDGSWMGHAAMEVRRFPHRLSFLRPDGSRAANAGVNHAVVIWKPNPGYLGPWQPVARYWTYR
jgi:hypothetical protein